MAVFHRRQHLGKDYFMEHVLDVKKLVNELTLEEKASLCSGADFWHTKAIDRLNIPAAMVSDGPHGIRKQESLADHMGVAESIKAIGFPTASAMACSFDRDLLHKVGDALGEECVAEDLAVLLGPGINMKRSPICGRNFEYYSEDPVVAGELGAAFVNGVQEHGVGTSLKHFAANNQEWRRMSISAEIDERTLREIYLAAFETVVKKAQPWTIMCSYNRINGVYSCENDWLLNKVLRDDWGFEGLVMTDWGAMDERVPSLKAGLDLEMQDCHGETDKLIVKAVQSGELEEPVLDTAVERILTMVDKYLTARKGIDPASMVHPLPSSVERGYDVAAHHALARTTAEQSAVLLKNEDILPLQKDKKIAFIGEFAKVPRIQGGGSSHINNTSVESALDAAGDSVSYAQGFAVLQRASDAFGWKLDLASIARMWRGGCIIRSVFLNDIAAAFEAKDKPKHLLLAPYFRDEIKELLPGWKNLVAQAMREELPVPAFSSAMNYFYSLVSANLPANMIQAQRDYFGAHTFERKDELRGQFFHENWTGHGGDTKSGTYNN